MADNPCVQVSRSTASDPRFVAPCSLCDRVSVQNNRIDTWEPAAVGHPFLYA